MSEGKTIVLGVTGSIAACKVPDLVSKLVKRGHDVHVVMTAAARHFVTPLTLRTLSRNAVVENVFEEAHEGQGWRPGHIDLADRADILLIAPATANTIAALAHGFADDALTEIALAIAAPILVAPAMNGKMWGNAATQANVQLLQSRGFHFIGPEEGILACGYEGLGRLWNVDEIIDRAEQLIAG